MKLVITGVQSGFGKYLFEEFTNERHDVSGITRDSNIFINWKRLPCSDAVIHCAFKSVHTVKEDNVYEYIMDNIFFTNTVSRFGNDKTCKFIYLSSVQVYPNDGIFHSEDECIDLEKVSSTYGKVKLMAESIFKHNIENYLILRLPSIVGKYMRSNSFVKLVKGEPDLYLTGDSTNNYVGYEDVRKFIEYSIVNDLRGTYNVVSNEYLSIKELCAMFGNKSRTGSHCYQPALASNEKIVRDFPAFNKTSEQVVKEYAVAVNG